MILANLRIIPTDAPAYDFIWSYLVPLAIPFLLFQADFRKIWRESGRMFGIYMLASLGTAAGGVFAYLLLKNRIGVADAKSALAMFVGTYVAITTEFWIGNIAYLSTKDGLLVEMVVIKEPHGAFPVGHRHHAQFQIGILSPAPVLQAIDAHSVDIARLAIVGRVEGHAIHLKADMAMVVFLDHSKHWAVAGLQAPVGMTAVEGPRETVRPVLTDEGARLGPVLLAACRTARLLIIRWQHTRYRCLCEGSHAEHDSAEYRKKPSVHVVSLSLNKNPGTSQWQGLLT